MTEPTEKINQLVNGYLGLVERALHGIPESQRVELLNDLSEHIEAERAELPTQSEAAIREILDRLGDPEEIAEAARTERMSTDGAAGVSPVPDATTRPAVSDATSAMNAMNAMGTVGMAEPAPRTAAYPVPGSAPAPAAWRRAVAGGRRLGLVGWLLIAVAALFLLGCLAFSAFGFTTRSGPSSIDQPPSPARLESPSASPSAPASSSASLSVSPSPPAPAS